MRVMMRLRKRIMCCKQELLLLHHKIKKIEFYIFTVCDTLYIPKNQIKSCLTWDEIYGGPTCCSWGFQDHPATWTCPVQCWTKTQKRLNCFFLPGQPWPDRWRELVAPPCKLSLSPLPSLSPTPIGRSSLISSLYEISVNNINHDQHYFQWTMTPKFTIWTAITLRLMWS